MQKSRSALCGVALAVALTVVAGLPAMAFAQADGTDDASAADTVDATPAATATLQCSVIALRVMAPEVGGTRFVCHVDGAQSGDASFTAQTTQSDPQRAAAQLTPACTGSLVEGIGDCVGAFLDRASSTSGQFSVTATLEPSGATLGPVLLGPASFTPPVQPKPLLPNPPTAPINTFPLSEP